MTRKLKVRVRARVRASGQITMTGNLRAKYASLRGLTRDVIRTGWRSVLVTIITEVHALEPNLNPNLVKPLRVFIPSFHPDPAG